MGAKYQRTFQEGVVLKPGDYIHFEHGICCLREGSHEKIIHSQGPCKPQIHLPKAHISITAWGLLRQYINGRRGWAMCLYRASPRAARLVLTEYGRIPHNYDMSERPLVLMYDPEEQAATNSCGIQVILWCLMTLFGTEFAKTHRGQCLVFTPIVKPALDVRP